ncbi:hypothetical protein Tco_0336146 [Tanacetum coccineum]
MDTTKVQQKELDDALVAPENHLKIGKCNLRLSSSLTSKEPTLQVALDALKLTPFYNAFEVSANVPEIYMQEFWATVTKHHFSLRFKINGKSHTVNVDNFRNMLKIYPKLPGQNFEEPPFEEEIIPFIRDLGHTGEIKHLTNQAMLESEAYKTYRAYATGEKTPKSKATKKKTDFESSPKTKPTQASKGKRIKTLAKGDKIAKKKQPAKSSKAKGLTVLYDVALTEAEQLKLTTKRSLIQTHSSHASSSVTDEGTGGDDEDDDDNDANDNDDEDTNEVNNSDEDNDENDKDDEDDDQAHDSEEAESDDDEDDLVHPNLSTYNADDQEEDHDEEKANDDED